MSMGRLCFLAVRRACAWRGAHATTASRWDTSCGSALTRRCSNRMALDVEVAVTAVGSTTLAVAVAAATVATCLEGAGLQACLQASNGQLRCRHAVLHAWELHAWELHAHMMSCCCSYVMIMRKR